MSAFHKNNRSRNSTFDSLAIHADLCHHIWHAATASGLNKQPCLLQQNFLEVNI